MYGSATMRTYYGAGDYNRGLAYAQGYYAGGGFFSKLKKVAQTGIGLVSKVASNPLVGAGLSFIPGGGLIAKGAQLAGRLLKSPVGRAVSTGLGFGAATGLGEKAIGLLGGGGKRKGGGGGRAAKMLPEFPRSRSRGGGRSRPRGAGRPRASRSRGRGRRSYGRGDYDEAGDWGDDGGRDKRGHYLNKRGGHRHFRRRRRGRGGRRVSFMARGKRVSFTTR